MSPAPPRGRDLVIAGVVTLAIGLYLRPSSGQDSLPPKCWNLLGAEVSCDGTVWPIAVAAGVVAFLACWAVSMLRTRDQA